MKYASMLLLALFVVLSGASIGKTQVTTPEPPKIASEQLKPRIVSREELYYFSADGLRTPLRLAPSVIVRFRGPRGVNSAKHMERYAPRLTRDLVGVYTKADFALEFIPNQDTSELTRTLQRMSIDPILDGAPVFVVDGMEAVVDGIYITTTTPLSLNTVRSALKEHFGEDMELHEITPENGTWHVSFKNLFFLGDKKVPLHVLSLTNLIHTSKDLVWVKRAYPKFAFLHAPVIATVSVTPVSGTVGEKRTVVLGLRIFGNEGDVVIGETDIPEFMLQGAFVPKSNGQPPQVSFIEISNPQKTERERVGPNEWYMEHRYKVGLYAPETEWKIEGFQIPYQYRGISRVTNTGTTTFFTRPHLDGKYKLSDMPEAMRFPKSKPPALSPAPPTPEKAWFDVVAKPIGGRTNFSIVLFGITVASTFLAAFGLIGLAIHIVPRFVSGTKIDAEITRRNELYKKAEKAKSKAEAFLYLHEALSCVLHRWNKEFSAHNVTYQDVKAYLATIQDEKLLRRLLQHDLERLFNDLESRNEKGFEERDTSMFQTLYADVQRRIQTFSIEIYAERGP